MPTSIRVYRLLLFAATLVSLGLSGYGWHRRECRGGLSFAGLMLAGALYSGGYAMELGSSNLQAILSWVRMEYLGIPFVPTFFFILSLEYGGIWKMRPSAALAVLFIIPAVTLIAVYTNDIHGLFYRNATLNGAAPFPVVSFRVGILYYLQMGYMNLMILAGSILMLRNVLHSPKFYRKQALTMLFGTVLPWTGYFFYIFGASPYGIDLCPLGVALAGIPAAFGLFRFKLFDLIPIARTTVFECMTSGIFVLDEEWKLLDANGSARAMLPREIRDPTGSDMRKIFPEIPEAMEDFRISERGDIDEASFSREIIVKRSDEERFIELRATQLHDPEYGRTLVIIADDVTEIWHVREEILRHREEIAAAAERDRLVKELHDNLGQVLSFAVIQTDTILREAENNKNALTIAYLKRLREILAGAHDDLRGFVRGIKEAEYETITLSNLLRQETELFRRTCTADVIIQVSTEETDVTAHQKMHLARIVREALNNIAKHAAASKATIRLARESGEYTLTIEDDGTGFPEGTEVMSRGSGIFIMKERAESIGGDLKVSSMTGRGTRLVLAFPGTKA